MRLVTQQWWRQSGNNSACAPTSGVRRTTRLPPVAKRDLSDLRLAGIGVVGDGDPIGLGDLLDQPFDLGAVTVLDADRELDPARIQALEQFVVLKPDVGAEHDLAGVAGASHAGQQLIDKPLRAALVVCV